MGRKRKRSAGQLDGVLILDKPGGPSSAACLNTIRKHFGQGRIGHAGTLDPMATGVLVVLLGEGTKLAPYLLAEEKSYLGELQLGITTDTYDSQGKVVDRKPFDQVPEKSIKKSVLAWQDLKEQEVPPVSAAKHQGKPLYALARAGLPLPVKKKEVTIFHVEVLETAPPLVRFRVSVSAGTYVRSLVHSLGMRLGCGAMLTMLRRERCCPYTLDEAHTLEALMADRAGLEKRVIPITNALPHWPVIKLSHEESRGVLHGIQLPVSSTLGIACGTKVLLSSPEAVPLALAEVQKKDGMLTWGILRGLRIGNLLAKH